MKQQQQAFRKLIAIQFSVIVLLYFLLTIGYDLAAGSRLTDSVSSYAIRDDSIRTADLAYDFYGDEGTMELEDLWVQDRKIFYTVRGLEPGETFLTFHKAGTQENLASEQFRVMKGGKVVNVHTGNHSNWQVHLFINVVLLTLFAGLCLIDLLWYRNRLRYSYEFMFTVGLLIWLTCTVIIQWYAYLHRAYVYAYYASLQTSAYQFMLYTAPVVWIFCIALSISNISLIRHEGYRRVNALGIMISVGMILGSLIGTIADNVLWGATPVETIAIRILMSTYCSVYSLFACLLEGAVINGILAAKHILPMDCDYIIILGCTIRKDGSLTPLLRGRVDRAIIHGRMQEQTTGHKVVYVPSGGQGAREVMAEGQAMKNYLLSQGIPEEQILVEDKSRNTAENMDFSRKLIEARTPDAKIAFSTTNYHVFRSGIIATQKGFCPEGMGSKTKWYFWPNAFIREFLGMLVYTKVSVGIALTSLIVTFAVIEVAISR